MNSVNNVDNAFINPYTFIPVNNGKKKEYSSFFSGTLLSGKITCTLRTRTQIAVCDDTDDERTKEFFSIDGKTPVIPGSEIRGVIRSIYEALTDSCLSSVNAEDDDYFSSRMKKNKPGLLRYHNGKYYLYSTIRYKDDDINFEPVLPKDIVMGTKVHFSVEKAKNGIIHLKKLGDREPLEGYVHRVDYFSNGDTHNFMSIFQVLPDAKRFEIPDEAIKRLKINLDAYTPNDPDRKKEYMDAFDAMCSGKDYLPIWYINENGHYYFAPSQNSGSIYFQRPIDLLKMQNLQKCGSKSKICEACSLFGIVNDDGEGNGFAVASRLRFSDARFVRNLNGVDPLDKIYRLPILAQPRISSFEFYLSNPDPNMSYGADDKLTRIAGRKYYWHNNSRSITTDSTAKLNNMDSKVRLLKKDTEFTFDIFFDRITEEMLRKLVFAINLGENDIKGKQCHKLGYGKPIGLGSVKIAVDKITVRSFTDGKYIESDDMTSIASAANSTLFGGANVQNVLKVTDFEAVEGELISYPCTTQSTDIFDWFAENRVTSSRSKPRYRRTLPKPLDKDLTLPKYKPKKKKNN